MALYDEIGGAQTVRAVLDAFYPRVLADATLGVFFLGVDIDRLKKTQEAFLAMVLGGPNAYAGRSLAHAHARTRQRGANDAAFDRFVAVLKGVLIDVGLPDGKIEQLLVLFEGARGQVLGQA